MGTIYTSLFVIAVGAILRYAVTEVLGGVILPVVGLILIVIGAVGLAIGLYFKLRQPPQGAPTQ